ncbi:thymidylate synthase (FAD) [Thermanaeromonas toyohensis ToBE]|uniref:Flavin-dependent thymidylate synthase n=1 Tax=Thermanaeromonas toyohensis ToBE TaxID=698762 RepID=A0A1W1V5C2_9FIRM|nr:FAD-dependent thymidylate synthase [Thermanaeromonas toyohensis]SMB88562.1 thymidylate synthase (FAD) [Thermanaeromonas toyohensis ToBE]
MELIAYTPEPEKIVAAAARICYSQRGAAEILENMEDKEVDRLIKLLLSCGHESPVEHVTFTFAIEGVSRALSHQLVRHRIASYSQRSQRYVSEENFPYIVPPSINGEPEALEIFENCLSQIREAYARLTKLVPREDARYILPQACETKLICTFNARSLFNFFRLRCCSRAQWEIRALALKMREVVRQVAPRLFAKAGPNCEVLGICYEGPFSCGRAPVVKSRGEIEEE